MLYKESLSLAKVNSPHLEKLRQEEADKELAEEAVRKQTARELEAGAAGARTAFERAQREMERAHARLVELNTQLAELQGELPLASSMPALPTVAVTAAGPAGEETGAPEVGKSGEALEPSRLKSIFQCRWETCMQVFENSEALDRHVLTGHLHRNITVLTCAWRGCKAATNVFQTRQRLLKHFHDVHMPEARSEVLFLFRDRLDNGKVRQRLVD